MSAKVFSPPPTDLIDIMSKNVSFFLNVLTYLYVISLQENAKQFFSSQKSLHSFSGQEFCPPPPFRMSAKNEVFFVRLPSSNERVPPLKKSCLSPPY